MTSGGRTVSLEDEVSTSMTISAAASTLLLIYQLVEAEQGVAEASWAAQSRPTCSRSTSPRHLHLPAAAVAALISDVFAYSHREIPRWNTISFCYHMTEAEATPAQGSGSR